VYDYAAGKADWGSYGLPLEGGRPSSTRVGPYVHADVPTCGADDRMREIRVRVLAAGWDDCLVVDTDGVVLGRLGREALADDDDVSAAEAMTLGPSTVRPSYELAKAVTRIESQDLTSLPVTRSNGTLVGLLKREDAERALARVNETVEPGAS